MKVKAFFGEARRFYRKLYHQRIIQKPKLQVKDLSEITHKQSPVFVLSTGRAGTMLLTEILALSNSLMVEHEPDPILNYYSKSAWLKEMPDVFYEGVFEGARYEIIRNATILNKVYVETNNRLTFLAPYILKRYPKARFIHLIRNQKDFVKSGLKRNWYNGDSIHDEGRIISEEGWSNLGNEERISWLWKETNDFIDRFFEGLPADQKIKVTSEDLFKNDAVLQKLLFFCSAQDIDLKKAIKIRSKKVNNS